MNLYAKYTNEKQFNNNYILDGLFSGIGSFFSSLISDSTDRDLAEQNLEYQRERNAIEDARYRDETEYNRQFAEDERNFQRQFAIGERNYQRALQQEIFNREDTAIERQASQLSKLGINPLSQQLNGLGAGQALSASVANPSSAPSMSSRGGKALHNSYKPSETFGNLMSPILSFANSLNNLQTGGFQRDLLREQADYQRLKNQEQDLINKRTEKKLEQEEEQRAENLRHDKSNNPNIEKSTKATAERNQRENVFQQEYGAYDNSPKEMRWATETAAQADRASKYVTDKVGDLSKSATKALAIQAQKGIQAYNKAMKKADNWIVDKYHKARNWFKKHTAPAEHLRDMYGF